jgi:hypothetical protein
MSHHNYPPPLPLPEQENMPGVSSFGWDKGWRERGSSAAGGCGVVREGEN